MSALHFGPHSIDFTHPDRVLFADDGFTKKDLLDYYLSVAPALLAALRDRPVLLQCFPDGIDADGYFRQEVADYFPDWLPAAARERADGHGVIQRILCPNRAALAYFVKLDAVTLHCGLARAPHLDRCDRMIFDLDPAEDDFEQVREGARLLGEQLRRAGGHPHLMTTGSRGLHVVVPLRPQQGHDPVRDLARRFAERLVDARPKAFTLAQRKGDRGGALYLDIMRNALGQSGVAPYALRARPGAPVAAPLSWAELDEQALHAQRWTLTSMPRRLQRDGDPWRGIGRRAVALRTLAQGLDA